MGGGGGGGSESTCLRCRSALEADNRALSFAQGERGICANPLSAPCRVLALRWCFDSPLDGAEAV